ncbi:hypothetical protein FACS189485_12390 [Spirochaetia bacterium]|nr:hypothetical protein FACS189485_12390 [Spirochaetia bacterium]
MNAISTQSDLLTRKQSAEFLRISLGTLDKLDISCVRIRRRVFFKKLILEKYLEDHSKVKGVQS